MRVAIIVRSLGTDNIYVLWKKYKRTYVCVWAMFAVWSICQNRSTEIFKVLNSAIELIAHLLMFVIKNVPMQS